MVETSTNEITIITGLSASEFEIPFPYWSTSDISVYLDGVLLKYGINYTLTTYEVAKKIGKFVLYPIDTDWGSHSELKLKRDTSTITTWNPFNYSALQPEDIVKNFDRVVGMIQDNAVKTSDSNDLVLSSEIVYLVEKSAIDITRKTEGRFTDESLSSAIVTYAAYDVYGRAIVEDYKATIAVNNCVAELDENARTIRITDIGKAFKKRSVQPYPGEYVNNVFIPFKYEKAAGKVPETDPPIYYSATTSFNMMDPQPEIGKSAIDFYTPTDFVPAIGYVPYINPPVYYINVDRYEFMNPQPEPGEDVSEFFIKEDYSKAVGFAPTQNAPVYYERTGDGSLANPYIYTELDPQPAPGEDVSSYYIEDEHYIHAQGVAPDNASVTYYMLTGSYEIARPQPAPGTRTDGYFVPNEFTRTSGVVEDGVVYFEKVTKYTELDPQPAPGEDVGGLLENNDSWFITETKLDGKDLVWLKGTEHNPYYIAAAFVKYTGVVPADKPVYYERSTETNPGISSGLVILTLTNKYNESIVLEKNLIAQIIQNGESYSITISSDRGNVFRPGTTTEMTLTAHLYQNGNEITNEETLRNLKEWFCWRRVSYYADPTGDEQFNFYHAKVGNIINITCKDINSKATYYCDLLAIT